MTKTTNTRAARKTGAKKSSKKAKRSGAKPRNARASRSPSQSVEAATPPDATPPAAKKINRRSKAASDAAIERAAIVAFREECSKLPREAWVMRIRDPRQRILADVAAKVCAVFGLRPDVLRADRKDQSDRSRNENSLRGMALGAVIDVGVAMGLGWNELHTHPEIGRSEVLDLPPHAATIRGAHGRWVAAQALDGIVMDVARRQVEDIKTAAVNAAGGCK